MIEKIDKFLNSIPMLIVSGVCLLISFIGEYIVPFYNNGMANEFMVSFAFASILISGLPLAYLALSRVVKQRFVSSALLITIAMIAAVYIGDYFAAGEVAFIMAIGAYLEERTVKKAKKGIEKLLNLVPLVGRIIQIDETGNEIIQTKDAKNLVPKDIIRVLPGESFPADGIIIIGTTSVNQSVMTGESLPVDKTVGDSVFSGTINTNGSVDVKVTKSFSDSSLQKLIQLVEEAEHNKAPMQKVVDKWATFLVPIACAIAVITYIVIAFMLNQPDSALIRAVTVLVVFCPCALALATPTSIMAAIAGATKQGVLIKSGQALEEMGEVSIIAFDKTGTITKGILSISDIIPFDIEEEELISLGATIEGRSEHPIGKALWDYANTKDYELMDMDNFTMIPGKGVFASINGEKIYCGNEKLMATIPNFELTKELMVKIDDIRSQGKALILIANEDKILGIIGLWDTIKDHAKQSIEVLKEVGIEKTVLLTGDNEKSANTIAKQVGISSVFSSLLPKDKVEAVGTLLKNEGKICMVGDGVNDAPALKAASVGIAMGTMGSDIAIDAADIAILGDDISKVAYIKKLSKATLSLIKINITLSMAINFVAIILSIAGLLNPATGALVHNAGSVLVVLNAARLYERKI